MLVVSYHDSPMMMSYHDYCFFQFARYINRSKWNMISYTNSNRIPLEILNYFFLDFNPNDQLANRRDFLFFIFLFFHHRDTPEMVIRFYILSSHFGDELYEYEASKRSVGRVTFLRDHFTSRLHELRKDGYSRGRKNPIISIP